MFSLIKKSWKAAAAERIVRDQFGCSISPQHRRAMHNTFNGVLDGGGNEYDAAITAVLVLMQMVFEGPMLENGPARHNPMSEDQRATIRRLVDVLGRAKPKSLIHNSPDFDQVLSAFLAAASTEGASPAEPEISTSEAGQFLQKVLVEISKAAADEFSDDPARTEHALVNFYAFITSRGAPPSEELAAEYIVRGYLVEDSALLFLDGTIGAFKKFTSVSNGLQSNLALLDAMDDLERVVDRLFFVHVRRTRFPTIFPRYGKAARSMDPYMKDSD